MKETGIIFSTQLIPSLLDGTKTQTRRTRGLKLINNNPASWEYVWNGLAGQHCFYDTKYLDAPPVIVKCPYGQVGDRLWVRETWAITDFSYNYTDTEQLRVLYRDGFTKWRTVDWDTWRKYATQRHYSWQSPLFMPRWASRILLDITEIRLERLQEITQADVIAEGLSQGAPSPDFSCLWDSINLKRYPWSMNPWVWVINFRRINA